MNDYFQNTNPGLGDLYEEGSLKGHQYYVKVKSAHFVRLLKRQFGDLSNLDCLSIGCGTGEAEAHFSKYFKQVIGIDYSKSMIEKAKSRNIPNTIFKVMDASKMNVKNDAFNVIVMFTVIHHVTSRHIFDEIMRNVHRVLKNGGLFYNYDMNPLNPITRMVIKRLEIDRDVNLEGFSKDRFPTTLFASEFTHLAEKTGFKQIRKETLIFFPRWLSFLTRLEFLINKTPFGGLYCLVFKKV